ncbi:hypothetical protein G5I_06478 [Acromyrmex echinatior]|uniref:Ig-like domain-containing protein n=1 Tax=Acromyrmex echinatior TaxID=103372 RepID=F4WL54_ACREC|nr:hypothetical protein G5I_06478 [Acromyrmex echinatior]
MEGSMFADAMNSLVEDVVVEAGKNVTLGCPGVTEDSLVLMLEWRANGMRLLEYKSRSTTVVRRTEQNRMSLSLKNYSLQLHPVTAADSGMYECLVNNRNTPEAVIKLIVRGSACFFSKILLSTLSRYFSFPHSFRFPLVDFGTSESSTLVAFQKGKNADSYSSGQQAANAVFHSDVSFKTRTTIEENGECSANGLVRFYLMLERRDLFTANSQCSQ